MLAIFLFLPNCLYPGINAHPRKIVYALTTDAPTSAQMQADTRALVLKNAYVHKNTFIKEWNMDKNVTKHNGSHVFAEFSSVSQTLCTL